MDIIMQIQDADDGDSLLGYAGLLLRGFPSEALLGLYVFEDGAVGAAYPGPAPDLTTFKANAAMMNGGAAKRAAAGVVTSGGTGFMLDTGIPYGGRSFTAFGVFANQLDATASEQNQLFWGSSAAMTGNRTAVMLQDRYHRDYHILRMIAPGGWFGLDGDRDAGEYFDTVNKDFSAWAVIWNATTGQMTLRFRGPSEKTATFAAADAAKIAAGMKTVTGTHAFGVRKDSGGAAGTLGLAGVIGAALTIGEVDAVLLNARAIVGARGASVT